MSYSKLKYLFIAVCFITISCTKDSTPMTEEAILKESLNNIENEILKLVNEHRVSIDKPELSLSNIATDLAKDHTEYMISKNLASHDNFENRFNKLVENANAKIAGENVASHYTSAQGVIDAWLSSAKHKENIEGDFTNIGIAAKKGKNDKYFYTQIFYK